MIYSFSDFITFFPLLEITPNFCILENTYLQYLYFIAQLNSIHCSLHFLLLNYAQIMQFLNCHDIRLKGCDNLQLLWNSLTSIYHLRFPGSLFLQWACQLKEAESLSALHVLPIFVRTRELETKLHAMETRFCCTKKK